MLVDCLEKSSSTWWGRGDMAWVIAGVVPIEPIPWRGKLNLWDCRFKYRPLKKNIYR
jgi:hypothetical protein